MTILGAGAALLVLPRVILDLADLREEIEGGAACAVDLEDEKRVGLAIPCCSRDALEA
ncbi:MAG TPA: hypothetical protein VMK12_32550 [Anaeromyxobacteraceae bacterium]|nr:hypothetical protein [Anaeromyxobacteraceae bacterium]